MAFPARAADTARRRSATVHIDPVLTMRSGRQPVAIVGNGVIRVRLPGLRGLRVANPRIDNRSRLRRLASLSQRELVGDESPVRVELVVANARGDEVDTAFVDHWDARSLVDESAI